MEFRGRVCCAGYLTTYTKHKSSTKLSFHVCDLAEKCECHCNTRVAVSNEWHCLSGDMTPPKQVYLPVSTQPRTFAIPFAPALRGSFAATRVDAPRSTDKHVDSKEGECTIIGNHASAIQRHDRRVNVRNGTIYQHSTVTKCHGV